MAVLIVPRGDTPEYYRFLAITARANGDRLLVDRRNADRRQLLHMASLERRDRSDRRGAPPDTWVRDGLIVAASAPEHSGSGSHQ